MRRETVLIAGGGPAGSAAAITLARSGVRALIIERTRETGDALCGGFLSWRTLETLAQLGVTSSQLKGHPIERVCIFSSNRTAVALLPQLAVGVSRRRLDGLLLNCALRNGTFIERGVAVRQAIPGKVELADGGTIDCDSLLLATGKTDCRGLERNKQPEIDPVQGYRLRIAASSGLTRLLSGVIELHLFRGGYAGLLLQEDGSANLCMAVCKTRMLESGGRPWKLLEVLAAECPQLGERLAYAASGASIQAIGSIPYGWRVKEGIPGLFRLGDQAAVIPSLVGEGIGIALRSGMMAAHFRISGGAIAAELFQAELARATAMPVGLAACLNHVIQNDVGRRIIPPVINVFPGLISLVARLTRIGY